MSSLPRSLSLLAASFLLGFTLASTAQTQHPGDPDPGFGIAGRITYDLHGGRDQILDLKPLKDGRFLAAGEGLGPNTIGPGSSANFVIARFLADGQLDPSFGVGGWREIDVDGGNDYAAAITVLPDRRILAAGRISQNTYGDFAVARLLSDGTLDTEFGQPMGNGRRGWNVLDVGGSFVHDEVVAMAVQSDGRIVVVGTTRVPVGNFTYQRVAVARFTSDGLVDTSFGGNGTGFVVLAPFFSDDAADYATGIVLTAGGRLPSNDSITVTGETFARNNAFIARLTANGQVDTTFGDLVSGSVRSGRTTFSASHSGGVHSGISHLAAGRLLDNGRIVLLGTGSDRGMTFMRLLGNGSLDTSFGQQGRRTVKYSGGSQYDEPAALAIQGNGRLVGAGYATSQIGGAPKDFFVVRLLADGSIDTGFGDGQGRRVVQVVDGNDEALAVAVEPSGQLLVGGNALRPGTNHLDFALLRLNGERDRLGYYDFELPRN